MELSAGFKKYYRYLLCDELEEDIKMIDISKDKFHENRDGNEEIAEEYFFASDKVRTAKVEKSDEDHYNF